MVVSLLAFELGVEALEHHVARDAVAFVLRLGAFEVAAGGFTQGGARGVPVGREVGQLGLRAGDAEAGREVGVQGGDGADVGVSDFRYLASFLGSLGGGGPPLSLISPRSAGGEGIRSPRLRGERGSDSPALRGGAGERGRR